MIESLLKKYPIISDQIEPGELRVILQQLHAVLESDVHGAVVEFGCYVGTTSLFIQRLLMAQKQRRDFYVYDSFAGLPDKLAQDESPAGTQFKPGELLATKAEFIRNFKKAGLALPRIRKGVFEDLQSEDIPERIAFAFLDGDYYSSIKFSLSLIWPRLSDGAVVIVDDYQSEALPGAQKAVDEWLRSHPAKLRITQSLAILYNTNQ